jgi:hypothetical protein
MALKRLLVIVALVGCSEAADEKPPPRSPPPPSPPPVVHVEPPPPPPPPCERVEDVRFFVSPSTPIAGQPLRIVAVSDTPHEASLVVESVASARRGGPPWSWIGEIAAPEETSYTAKLVAHGCELASRTVSIAQASSPPASPKHGGWTTENEWSHDLENLYSAWIERLFDAPENERPTWDELHDVLRDRERNFLFDYLGAGEDSVDPPVLRPDCADLPYVLRAYFASKLHLPFGVARCSLGALGRPPRCTPTIVTNEDPPPRAGKTFGGFVRATISTRVHSGFARVPLDDERSDYYPVPLTWESLRPGTVYADPYGHVFLLVKRLPQNAQRGGILFVVDGQPDGTVARKRFWRGNFLYADDKTLGGPGWKRFRPLSREGDRLVRWSDHAIEESPEYGDVSREQGSLSTEEFFDAMDDVLSPHPLDARRKELELVAALEEQIKTRVDSVDMGREWLAGAPPPARMPGLKDLFETTGTWEDFSTPSRDFRLLVAIDFVSSFPESFARRPARYAMPAGESVPEVEHELSSLLERELAARTIAYPRTDGSSFTLSLAEVLARKASLEVAYNPNDCPEVRWGAEQGSDEEATCRARAPADQQRHMDELRPWFHERRRPPRT